MEWHVYCITCKKEIDNPANNGQWQEAVARLHMKKNKNHVVIVGYLPEMRGENN